MEADPLPDDLNDIRPNIYNNNLGTDTPRLREKVAPFDPVMEILKKRKKKPTDISLTLSLDIPSKELYEVLIDDYEDAENKLIDYLFTSENITLLKESVKVSLREHYGIYPQEIIEV